jgi:hypothetical protein
MVGIWWDGNPFSFAIIFPFVRPWCEHEGGHYRLWNRTILRVVPDIADPSGVTAATLAFELDAVRAVWS